MNNKLPVAASSYKSVLAIVSWLRWGLFIAPDVQAVLGNALLGIVPLLLVAMLRRGTLPQSLHPSLHEDKITVMSLCMDGWMSYEFLLGA